MQAPQYGRAALADLMPSALAALGVPGEANALDLPPAGSVVVLVVDGLGWEALRAHADQAPFLAALPGRPITAGFPTTTAVSLASIGTGRPPGQHGILGYTTRFADLAAPMNWLAWAPSGSEQSLDDAFPPEQVQPAPTAFERGVAAGVDVHVVSASAFRNSGLTRAALRGGTFDGVVTVADTIARAAAAARGPEPNLVYCYTSDLDLVGHVRGTDTEAWRLQLTLLDRIVEMLSAALPPTARLYVTADHGMVDVADAGKIDFDAEPALSTGVDMLANDARCRYVYTTDVAGVRSRWQTRLGDDFAIVTRAEAIAAGWFGPDVRPDVADRIGDLIAVATGARAVVRRTGEPRLARLIGQHGALTSAESLVPLLGR